MFHIICHLFLVVSRYGRWRCSLDKYIACIRCESAFCAYHYVLTLSIINKSANTLALCHPPSASFCSVLAGQWCSHIFTHDRYNILSDILIEFEVNLGIIIEKYAKT